jgi:3-hydroxybutyryl-CoA dehydratase
MQVGDTKSWERTFTLDEVRLFAHLSGDKGAHHILPDEQGRVMVHGLLTATLPTKLGGDLNYIARSLNFDFLRPVYAGDTVRCIVTVTQLEQQAGRTHMTSIFTCFNQHGKRVLAGETQGVVREPEPEEMSVPCD